MIRRRVSLVLVALVLGACAPPSSPFVSDAEELAYLSALGNPSVEQFRRRAALKEKADVAWKVESARIIREARENILSDKGN